MANAGMRGRPVARLLLSAQERSYLEFRRHRVARSLSERCRVILRCADGLPSKAVAAELGLNEHTVGKWRRRFLKDRCDGLLDEAPRPTSNDRQRSGCCRSGVFLWWSPYKARLPARLAHTAPGVSSLWVSAGPGSDNSST
jgi:DNA-binding CsgD family transcriptional regulator